MIITIGREYGSNGHRIGEMVAERMGIKLYDKKSLALEAEKSEHREVLKAFYEEEPVTSLLYVIATSTYNNRQSQVPFQFIRQIAEQESCVIIGRCGNHILRDHPKAFSVFVHAPLDFRIERIAAEKGIEPVKARRLVEREDKAREWFHTYYADEKWNIADGYHLCVDSSIIMEEEAADLITGLVQKRER